MLPRKAGVLSVGMIVPIRDFVHWGVMFVNQYVRVLFLGFPVTKLALRLFLARLVKRVAQLLSAVVGLPRVAVLKILLFELGSATSSITPEIRAILATHLHHLLQAAGEPAAPAAPVLLSAAAVSVL